MARIFIWQAIVRQRLYFYTASLFIICHAPSHSFAATAASKDSVLPVRLIFNLSSGNNQVNAELTDIESEYGFTMDNRKAFSRLRKLTSLHIPVWSSILRSRLFNDLAGVSAKLKLYAIAMKCYYSGQHDLDLPDPACGRPAEDDLPDSTFPATGLSASLPVIAPPSPPVIASPSPMVIAPPSPPVNIGDILASFNDSKTASSYALLVEVKQPIPGKRKSFTHINNVGHMFITLIKYNSDNSFVSRSFGFYPQKSSLLAATPLHPSSPSVVKDDSGHDWDEIAGKFISPKRFYKIIGALQSYDHRVYHLNRNNCTDFGLTMARIGGINIMNTVGRWPLGKGNNPGNAGQSMLEQKLANTDEEFSDPLFVSSNVR
jgi:hypothetical protein